MKSDWTERGISMEFLMSPVLMLPFVDLEGMTKKKIVYDTLYIADRSQGTNHNTSNNTDPCYNNTSIDIIYQREDGINIDLKHKYQQDKEKHNDKKLTTADGRKQYRITKQFPHKKEEITKRKDSFDIIA